MSLSYIREAQRDTVKGRTSILAACSSVHWAINSVTGGEDIFSLRDVVKV